MHGPWTRGAGTTAGGAGRQGVSWGENSTGMGKCNTLFVIMLSTNSLTLTTVRDMRIHQQILKIWEGGDA